MENNIFDNAIAAVADGAKFTINFKRRTLKINKKYIIRDGKYEGELGQSLCSEQECLSEIERLYSRYKHSVPTERSEGQQRRYFKAFSEYELSDEDLLFGIRRDIAQIELELFILCQILLGFKWNPETMSNWFWQSDSDKDLILLRDWIDNKQS